MDQGLVSHKLGLIDTYISDLKRLARPEELASDVRELRFVTYTLQIAIQAALDVASHIVSSRRLGEPKSNHDLFDLLLRDGWVSKDTLATLQGIVGFRNIVVHAYDNVDPGKVRQILETGLGDLTGFAAAIRARLQAAP